MSDFFRGVRKHIGKLDAAHLREQFERATDALERSEMLIRTLKEGLVRLDSHGFVIQANPAAKQLLGMSPEDFLPTLALPLGKSSKREIAVTYPEARTLEIQTIPFNDETIVYVRDITAEKARTEDELRAGATKAVQDLAAGVAHEIGNPLNAISLNLQLVERDPSDKEAIAVCRSQVERLDVIIRGFLAALRPQRPNLAAGSLADPLRDCLAAMREQLVQQQIKVTLEIPAALPAVALDKAQIEQVFFNIIKNALEAMKDGDSIDISVGSDDHDVTVSISDTGRGMSNEQLAHLFEPYRTTKEKGTGLGLMVSKRIVSDHGGSIDVESKPGCGTTFSVRFPRLEKRIRQLPQEPREAEEAEK